MRLTPPSEWMTALESRTLLAGTASGTEPDGDQWRLDLTGPGTLNVSTLMSGAINQITLAGTTAASALRLSVTFGGGGDGRATLAGLQSPTPLKSVDLLAGVLGSDDSITLSQVGRFTLGAASAAAAITLGGDSGTRTAVTLGTIDPGSSVLVGSRVTTLSVTGALGVLFNLTNGADRFNVSGAFDSDILVTQNLLPVSLGVVSFAQASEVEIDTPGAIGRLLAPEFTGGTSVEAGGRIGAIRVTGNLSGQYRAASFGSIFAGGDSDAEFFLGVPDASAKTFGSLRVVGTADGVGIGVAAGGTRAVIGSIDVGGWLGGTISAARIDSLRSRGSLQPTTVNLNPGADTRAALGRASITCTMGGTWTLAGVSNTATSISSLVAGRLLNLSLSSAGRIGSIRVTQSILSSQVGILAPTMGSLRVQGGMSLSSIELTLNDPARPALGSLISAGPLNGVEVESAGAIGTVRCASALSSNFDGRSIGTFQTVRSGGSTGTVEGTVIEMLGAAGTLAMGTVSIAGALINSQLVAAAGGVRALSAGQISQCIIEADFATSIKTTARDGQSGDFFEGAVTLRGADSAGFGLRSASFAGNVFGLDITSIGSVGTFTARRFDQASLIAGSNAVTNTFTGAVPLGPSAGGIGRFTLTGAFDPLNPTLNFAVIAGRFINSVSVTPAIPANNATAPGEDFGFAARTYGVIKLRNQAGAPLPIANTSNPGDVRPFGLATDFVIRTLP